MAMVFLYNNFSKNDLLLSMTTRSFLFIVFSALIVVPVTTYFYSSTNLFDIYGDFFEKIDLTGRGEIWQLSIEQVNSHPFWGIGYAAFWGTGTVPDVFNVPYRFFQFINQSHNGYIDLLVQLGVIGLVLVMLMMSFLWKEILILRNKFLINIFFFYMIHNVTESSFIRDSHLAWCMVLFTLAVSFLESNNDSKTHNFS